MVSGCRVSALACRLKAAAVAVFCAAVCLGVFAPVYAQELGAGKAVYSLQFMHGVADLVTPESRPDPTGSITAYDHSEWGGHFQYQRLFSDDWALAVSVGLGTFSEKDTPGDNADPTDPEFEYRQSSWSVRLGADRFAHLGTGFHIFAGPGIQYWSGKAKFIEGEIETESSDTSRIALSARMGAIVALGPSFGLSGQIGGYFGRASAEDAGAKATWWPSGVDGTMGVSVFF